LKPALFGGKPAPAPATETWVIGNPRAGGGAPDELREQLARYGELTFKASEGPGHAQALARDAARAGVGRIVVAGGDGTLHEVVNGVLRGQGQRGEVPIIVPLPLGTGNDFCRTLGVPLELEGALESLSSGVVRRVDVVEVIEARGDADAGRFVINAVSGGFSGEVGQALDVELKASWGPLSYLRGAIEALSTLRSYAVRLDLDGEVHEIDAVNIVVANGRYAARGIPIAPKAEPDDGVLDVVVIKEAPIAQLLALAPAILGGTHLDSDDDRILFRRARHVTIESSEPIPFNLDGEVVEEPPVRLALRVRPGALRVLVSKANS
jgi:diacylglycerol kinase (ATP)